MVSYFHFTKQYFLFLCQVTSFRTMPLVFSKRIKNKEIDE